MLNFESCRWVRTCNVFSSRRTFSSRVPKNGSSFPAMCMVRFIHVEDFSGEATAAGFPMAGIDACAANRLTASRSPIVLVPSDPTSTAFQVRRPPTRAPFTALLFTLTYPYVTVKPRDVTVRYQRCSGLFCLMQRCSDGSFGKRGHNRITSSIRMKAVLAQVFLQEAVVVNRPGKIIEISGMVFRGI